MKSVLASLALFAVAVLAQNLTIYTPSNIVECQPSLLSWTGGTPPYYVSILPGSQPNGAALESLPATNSTSLTWTCNIASGTSIGFTLRDNTGAVAQTAPVNVNAGSSSSCVNITSVPGGSATPSSSPASTAGASSAGVTTTPAGTTASSAAHSSSPSASSTSTSTSGASANVARLGAAGLAGVAIAALFL